MTGLRKGSFSLPRISTLRSSHSGRTLVRSASSMHGGGDAQVPKLLRLRVANLLLKVSAATVYVMVKAHVMDKVQVRWEIHDLWRAGSFGQYQPHPLLLFAAPSLKIEEWKLGIHFSVLIARVQFHSNGESVIYGPKRFSFQLSTR